MARFGSIRIRVRIRVQIRRDVVVDVVVMRSDVMVMDDNVAVRRRVGVDEAMVGTARAASSVHGRRPRDGCRVSAEAQLLPHEPVSEPVTERVCPRDVIGDITEAAHVSDEVRGAPDLGPVEADEGDRPAAAQRGEERRAWG